MPYRHRRMVAVNTYQLCPISLVTQTSNDQERFLLRVYLEASIKSTVASVLLVVLHYMDHQKYDAYGEECSPIEMRQLHFLQFKRELVCSFFRIVPLFGSSQIDRNGQSSFLFIDAYSFCVVDRILATFLPPSCVFTFPFASFRSLRLSCDSTIVGSVTFFLVFDWRTMFEGGRTKACQIKMHKLKYLPSLQSVGFWVVRLCDLPSNTPLM